ncbi:MAG TPA: EAL domain-containing protein [Solirubrobacterales bacterium]|jgi:diguanylate cyclase (GGDEF)-like protein/PAS domain S-box-containing protein
MPVTANGNGPSLALLENLPDAIVLVDQSGAVKYANAAAERLFDYSIGELASRRLPDLLAEPFRPEYEAALRSYAGNEEVPILGQRREVACARPDGSAVRIELSLSEVRVGEIRSLVVMAREIQEAGSAKAEPGEGADHDSLTGLLNRVGFEHALTEHAEYAARYGSGGSVIALGIDTFKYVNETLGSAAGDEVLDGMADALRGRLRKTDVLARVGGDVFGILVHGADKAKSVALAEQLLELARKHAFVVKGEPLRITVSAGVTSLDERTVVGKELLAEAETAMHAAKEAGRDRVVGFDANGQENDERRIWTERVRQATERGLFILTSQPIVNLESGETTQHEVLLRMRDDGGGVVQPGAFLATAERFGLIGGIDRWVTQQAVRLIEAQKRQGHDLVLEVNLSGKTMGDARFPDDVKKLLTNSGIDPACLIFEVTETAAVAEIELARSFIQSLSRLGCRFALDDFGAGYASFYYLKHLPISYLKIDGEFVKNLPEDHTDQLIVKALVEVCQGLGIKTIAEFVGDQQTMDMVRDLGVDFAQGYHLGKPEPVSALRAATAG